MATEKILPSKKRKRISWKARLKRDVQLFHAQTGMKFTTIGRNAIKDSRFWERLQNGGTVTIEKADSIYDYMLSQGVFFNS